MLVKLTCMFVFIRTHMYNTHVTSNNTSIDFHWTSTLLIFDSPQKNLGVHTFSTNVMLNNLVPESSPRSVTHYMLEIS